jgi:hypothetical protein
MAKAWAELQEVDVAGDGAFTESEGESVGSEVAKVLWCEINRVLHSESGRIVEQHKALQGLVPLLVRGGDLQRESRKLGGVVLLSGDVGGQDHRVVRGASGLVRHIEVVRKCMACDRSEVPA